MHGNNHMDVTVKKKTVWKRFIHMIKGGNNSTHRKAESYKRKGRSWKPLECRHDANIAGI